MFTISQIVCPWQTFLASLMFVGKARNPERFFTRVGSSLANKHKTKLKRLARDKHSSLLQTVNYECKKLYNVETCYIIFSKSLPMELGARG
jgi:hypothetical protein